VIEPAGPEIDRTFISAYAASLGLDLSFPDLETDRLTGSRIGSPGTFGVQTRETPC